MRGSSGRGKLSLLAYLAFLAVLLPGPAAVAQSSGPGDDRGGRAAGEAPPHQLIVKFEASAGPQARDDIRRAERLEKVRDLRLIRAEVVRAEGRPVEDAVRSLERHPGVEFAEPDYVVRPTGYADEPRFGEQWALENTGQSIMGSAGAPDVDVNAKEASALTQGDPDLVVAVIDSGMNLSHPDLKDRVWRNPGESGEGKETNGVDDDANGYVDDVHGWDFYNNDGTLHDSGNDRHGTHVAGILAASVNGEGVVGVAPNIKIMPLKILESTASTSSVVLAIEYAKAKGARILNSSWGGYAYSRALKDAIEASGRLHVAAAGNEGYNNDGSPFYPASYDSPNILSVAAIGNKGGLASFSNYGATSVDISAPGVDVLSTLPGFPEKPAAVLSSVGPSGGKALTAGFGVEGIDGTGARASFLRGAFEAVERGDQPVVLVDDDRSHAGYRDVGAALSSAIEAATGSAPEVINVPDGDGPPLSRLGGKTVVWATGQVNNSGSDTYGTMTTLTNADQRTLGDFLNGGGRLVLTGMDALHRIGTSSFVKDSLRLKVAGDVGRLSGLSGYARNFEGASGTDFAGQSYALGSSFANPTYHDSLAHADADIAQAQGLYPAVPPAWGYMSGTSMAAPHATGAAALAASSDTALLEDPVALKDRVMGRGKPEPATEGKTLTGALVDAWAASDFGAPAVSGVAPGDLSEGVALGAEVEATFSEAMDPSTLTGGTFVLTKGGGDAPVGASVSYDPAGRKATLVPEISLAPESTYVATVRGGREGVRDAAGNPLGEDKKWSFKTLDTAPPEAPTLDLSSDSDTGASATDDLTADKTPTFEGDAEAGSEVGIYDGTTLLGASTADGMGRYGFTVAGELGDGVHRITAKATDAAGNSSPASAPLELRIDNTAPSPPSITGPADNSYDEDGVFTVSGTAEADDTVGLLEDSSPGGTVRADAAGDWNVQRMGVAEGSHVYTAKATDAAGNTSVVSEARTLIVDATAPTVVAAFPEPGSSGVGVGTAVEATFSERMDEASINTGSFRLLRRRFDGTTVPVPATVTYDAQTDKAILIPDNNLGYGTTYIARITGKAKDLAGIPLSATRSWKFKTKR